MPKSVPSGVVGHPGGLERRVLSIVGEHYKLAIIGGLGIYHVLGQDVDVGHGAGGELAQGRLGTPSASISAAGAPLDVAMLLEDVYGKERVASCACRVQATRGDVLVDRTAEATDERLIAFGIQPIGIWLDALEVLQLADEPVGDSDLGPASLLGPGPVDVVALNEAAHQARILGNVVHEQLEVMLSAVRTSDHSMNGIGMQARVAVRGLLLGEEQLGLRSTVPWEEDGRRSRQTSDEEVDLRPEEGRAILLGGRPQCHVQKYLGGGDRRRVRSS
ncbi:MAG: hypothetical protein A4E31_00273 [Methanomassiliicoccales archaeon PtaU1.Bin030]|nr:MAG: hypothetical protein A4E31_00273 [Methanomassiliicoccales archaeon PtaU1.Bin030]